MDIHNIHARDLPDLWFQAVHDILDHGRRFVIDRGSYEGQTRLEYDYFMGNVKHPGTQPLIPDIPPACGIPNPVEHDYIYGGEGYDRAYIEYLMSARKEPGESYTYGERLTRVPLSGDKLSWWEQNNTEIIDKRDLDGNVIFEEDGQLYLNQIEWVIATYKKFGQRNNQLVLQIAHPSDLTLLDPPCLRSIDTRIQDDFLLMNTDGYPPAVINHADTVVVVNDHVNEVAKACHGFINTVIDNFIDQMMQAGNINISNIHCR
ncbi:unnamed protein product, partial [marine sediment metagenome]